ncbi:MAG: hypothetical protein AAF664_06600 [Planctomycetota bacterium]
MSGWQKIRLRINSTWLLTRWWVRRLAKPWTKKRGSRRLTDAGAAAVGEAAFFFALLFVGIFGLSIIIVSRLAPEAINRIEPMIRDRLEPAISAGPATYFFAVIFVAAIVTSLYSLFGRVLLLVHSDEHHRMLRRQLSDDARQWIDPVMPNPVDGDSKISPKQSQEASEVITTLPSYEAQVESPGERLTYRLPASGPLDSLLGIASLATLWNTAWFVLLAVSILGFWNGTPRWILTCLLVPLGWLGVWAMRDLFGRLRKIAGVGPTIIEISEQPLYPGDDFSIWVVQTGRMNLKRLTVHLECWEKSYYCQGTDVRIDEHRAYEDTLAKQRSLSIDRRRVWEKQLECKLPESMMHSFVSGHNTIRWQIVVRGDSKPWPSFCRTFPVIVHPPPPPEKRRPR